MRFSKIEQLEMDLADALAGAEAAELQAETGPYFPKLGMTKEKLLYHARKCREEVEEIEAKIEELHCETLPN